MQKALLQSETRNDEVEEIKNFLFLLPMPKDNIKQTVYTCDANGSQITKTTDEKTETNTYNAVNQLVGFTNGETIASYTYNADGLRASKTVDGETVKHVWDGAKQIVADVKNGAFYQANCYIRGTGLIAKYNYVNGAKSEYTYYTQNAHGDVVNLTDTDGIVIKTYKYDAFGVEKNIDDADTNAFRYCGEYYDAETGTIYLRARCYDPSNGRFTQRDSFAGKQGDPLSLNLYTYCHNNPIVGIDPSGNIFMPIPRKALETYIDIERVSAPNSYVIYSAYDKKETKLNKKQAKVIRKQYEKEYGGTCKVYEVNSAEEFVDTWNSLDDSSGIDAIQVISHGHYSIGSNGNAIGSLVFNDSSSLYALSNSNWTKKDKSITDINTKNVKNIYFSACNTANEDFTSNIAEAFFKRNPNADTVSGWDGGVTFRFRSLREGKFRVNKDFSVDRDDQNTFNHFMDKSGNVREPGLRELTRS